MYRPSARDVKMLVIAGLMSLLLLTGCSNPLSDTGDVPATQEAMIEATSTPAPPMPIITPTTVIPTPVEMSANQTPGTDERPESYVVAENDTLYEIAARFQLEISQLVEANELTDPNDIFVGQELIIPVPE